MTVRELICYLKKYNQDAEVFYYNSEYNQDFPIDKDFLSVEVVSEQRESATYFFQDLEIGEVFKFAGKSYIKTGDAYPSRTPLHTVRTNCICLDDKHRCTFGRTVRVEVTGNE